MTSGENETVAVDPARSSGVDLESLTKENGSDISRTKGKTKMSRLAGGDSIDGESAGIAGS